MLIIDSFKKLPFMEEYAVIINCGTKWYTALALASCLRHTKSPVLLIDCQSRDGSFDMFSQLSRELSLDFYWLSLPLRPHGKTLDLLFSHVPAKRLLLIDSDLELLSGEVVSVMRQSLVDADEAYGAGFLHRGDWMHPPEHRLPRPAAYYVSRMWIPLVMLDRQRILDALSAGESFRTQRLFAERFLPVPIARFMAYRYRLPLLRQLWWPRRQVTIGGEAIQPRPAVVEFDTGARLHQALLRQGLTFAEVPESYGTQVSHYHGVTRATLSSHLLKAATRLGLMAKGQSSVNTANLQQKARERLASAYPEVFEVACRIAAIETLGRGIGSLSSSPRSRATREARS